MVLDMLDLEVVGVIRAILRESVYGLEMCVERSERRAINEGF
jgi:hypothetical protein